VQDFVLAEAFLLWHLCIKKIFSGKQKKAFEYFGGVPHKVIFDNAKVAIKEGFEKYYAFIKRL
jgi:hypothetical protein